MDVTPELEVFMLPGETLDDTFHSIQDPKQLLLRAMLGKMLHELAEGLSTWKAHEAELEVWCAAGPLDGELGQFRRGYCNLAVSLPWRFYTITMRSAFDRDLTFADLQDASLMHLTFLPGDALELYQSWERKIIELAACPPPVRVLLNRVLCANMMGVAVGAGAFLSEAVVAANMLAEKTEAMIAANPARCFDEREYMPV